MIFLALTEGYDEPELIGPFVSEEAASEWGRQNFSFNTFWTFDTEKVTNPAKIDMSDPSVKYRTFTVLFVEEYDPANGVVMTDEEAVRELRNTLQTAYDDFFMPGTNFLVVKVEDGSDRFWQKWKEANT